MSDKGNSFLEKFKLKKTETLILLFAFIVGFVLLIGGSPLDMMENEPPEPVKAGPQDSQDKEINTTISQPNMMAEEKYLADKLQQMLAMVEGAGDVQVTVRLASSSRSEYAINTSTGTKTTEEKDQAGGTRVQTEGNDTGQLVLIKDNDGKEIPVLQQETAPNVSGVLVVATGASDPAIKTELFRAVRVALGVEPQKILVLPKSQ
ncbi:hypothetical protein V6C27_05565 [Peptococcaceae bacterium 1198_IL3148]